MAKRQASRPRRPRPMTAAEMGKKGGAARMAQLTREQRQELGRKAARARWGPPKT